MRVIHTENNICCKDIDTLGKIFCSLIGKTGYESVLAAYLDEDMCLRAVVEISVGTQTRVDHTVNDIYLCAVNFSSRKIVLAHNHPAGPLEPSLADIRATETVSKILELNNVSLLDHLIICGDKYVSVLKDS